MERKVVTIQGIYMKGFHIIEPFKSFINYKIKG